MTTPDSQARTLREGIDRQRIAQDVMREAAREIARERQASETPTAEGDATP